MKHLSALVIVVIAGGCTQPRTQEDPGEPARQVIEKAESRYHESQLAGHAWLKTKASLDAAKQALQAKDFAAAQAQAAQAVALADASLAQAQDEQNAWHERFPTVRSSRE
jgi:hypothetical protein